MGHLGCPGILRLPGHYTYSRSSDGGEKEEGIVAMVKQWRLVVEPERAVIWCRFADLPPETGLVRGDWTFAPEDHYVLGEVTPILEKSGEVDVAFYPERASAHVYLRMVDGVSDGIIWWDSCILVAPEDGGPCVLLPDRPGQFGTAESVPAQ
jgi:hypothetical protein